MMFLYTNKRHNRIDCKVESDQFDQKKHFHFLGTPKLLPQSGLFCEGIPMDGTEDILPHFSLILLI